MPLCTSNSEIFKGRYAQSLIWVVAGGMGMDDDFDFGGDRP